MFSPFFAFTLLFFLVSTPASPPPAMSEPLWLLDGSIQLTSGAADRCSVRDCTCRVVRGNQPSPPIVTISDEHTHHVYFEEDEFDLEESQLLEIRTFSSTYTRAAEVEITLVGYADGCGSPQENSVLSSNRARVVTQQIKRVLPRARITFRGAGEISAGHDPKSRRVDILVETKSNLELSIAKVDADVYLIDASGSLWGGWDGWRNIINSSFRPGSRIYVSKMHNCRNGMSIDAVSPGGGTEIWWSYWTVLDNMRPGETLAIISDFDSNYPLQDWEHRAIERKVREKGVRVIVIRL